jgi:hypothetical protein
MASDKQQFKKALRHWQELHANREYSYPAKTGKVAILVSFEHASSDKDVDSADNFSREAREFAKRFKDIGMSSLIIDDAIGTDVREVLQDRRFCSVYSIGHGALSYLYMNNGHRYTQMQDGSTEKLINDRVDWRDVSAAADHLKLGTFVQRHCGNYSRRLSVPLGTFAVADHSSIWAPVGSNFSPTSLTDPQNKRMGKVSHHSPLTYNYITENFDYATFLEQVVVTDLTSE